MDGCIQRFEFTCIFFGDKGADRVHFCRDDRRVGIGEGTETLGEEVYGVGVDLTHTGFIQGGDEF